MKRKNLKIAVVNLALLAVLAVYPLSAEKGKLYFEPEISFPTVTGFDFPVALYDNNVTGQHNMSNPIFIEHNSRLLTQFKGGYILPDDGGSFNISWMSFDSEEMTDLFPSSQLLIYPTSLLDANTAVSVDSVDAFRAWHKFQLTVFDFDYTGILISNSALGVNFHTGIRYAQLENDLQIRYYRTGENYHIVSNYKSDMIGPKFGFTAKSKVSKKVGLKANAAFSLLAGRADYSLINNDIDAANIIVDLDARDLFCLNPVTDIGLSAFYSPWKYITLNFGYKASIWFNAIRQIEFVDDYAESRIHNNYNIVMSGFFFNTTIFFG